MECSGLKELMYRALQQKKEEDGSNYMEWLCSLGSLKLTSYSRWLDSYSDKRGIKNIIRNDNE